MKILVIDDEKPTLSMFRLFLSAYGYEVHTAESGEAGLALFEDLAPDIVFTDIRMPGMDGLEVLERIRKTAPRCQVVIITGHGDMARAIEAMDLGASDFINKPVERQALNAALIRAEQRVARPDPAPFTVTPCTGEAEAVCLKLEGRLDQSCGPVLDRTLAHVLTDQNQDKSQDQNQDQALPQDQGAPALSLCLKFGSDISMDRQGLTQLTDRLKLLSGSGRKIRLTGLSYNILKFFEMAGIHKMAELEAEDSGEPGL